MKSFLTFLLVPLMSISMGFGTVEEGSLTDVLGLDESSYTTEDSSFYESEGVFFTGIMIVYFAFICGFILLWLLNTIVSVIFIVDCANRQFEGKTAWLVLLSIGLIIYYLGIVILPLYFFLVKRKYDKEQKR